MKKKVHKIIASSTHVDSHGDQMTLEALEQMRDFINSERKLRFGVDHNREFPPKGKISNGNIVEKDGFHYLEAEAIEYEHLEDIEWDKTLQIEYFDDPASFNEVKHDSPEITVVSIDPNNFSSKEEYGNFLTIIKNSDFKHKTKTHFRKSQIPDPEIIFTIGSGVFFFNHLVKPILKKTGEKIGDKVADKAVTKLEDFYAFVRFTIKECALRCVPKSRPLFIVFEINGDPQIELIAKTRDHKMVLKAIQSVKLKPIMDEIEHFSQNFEVDKIQFILTPKGKWKFNYLLTKQGASVGKKVTIKKRDKRFERIKLQRQEKNSE